MEAVEFVDFPFKPHAGIYYQACLFDDMAFCGASLYHGASVGRRDRILPLVAYRAFVAAFYSQECLVVEKAYAYCGVGTGRQICLDYMMLLRRELFIGVVYNQIFTFYFF